MMLSGMDEGVLEGCAAFNLFQRGWKEMFDRMGEIW